VSSRFLILSFVCGSPLQPAGGIQRRELRSHLRCRKSFCRMDSRFGGIGDLRGSRRGRPLLVRPAQGLLAVARPRYSSRAACLIWRWELPLGHGGAADVQRSRWRTDCFSDDLGAVGLVALRAPVCPQVWGLGMDARGRAGRGCRGGVRDRSLARKASLRASGGWCSGGSGFWYTRAVACRRGSGAALKVQAEP
jgi:hypothetical protein